MAEFTRGGARLPHDLRHLIVELELGVTDGIWGTIADGGIYTSMRFAGGHRLPHDAARKSDALKKARHHRIGRAELFANLVESIAALDSPRDAQVGEIIRRHLAVVPLSEPGQDPARVVELPPPGALVGTAVALRAAAENWAALPAGAELCYEWTPRQSPAAARQARATVPARPCRGDGKGSGKAGDRHGQRRRNLSADLPGAARREPPVRPALPPVTERLTYHLGEVNAVHPLREGNGRPSAPTSGSLPSTLASSSTGSTSADGRLPNHGDVAGHPGSRRE